MMYQTLATCDSAKDLILSPEGYESARSELPVVFRPVSWMLCGPFAITSKAPSTSTIQTIEDKRKAMHFLSRPLGMPTFGTSPDRATCAIGGQKGLARCDFFERFDFDTSSWIVRGFHVCVSVAWSVGRFHVLGDRCEDEVEAF